MIRLGLIVMIVFMTVMINLHADGAAIRSDEFGEQIRRIVNDGYSEGPRAQRATENINEEKPKRNCYDAPCGWSSYTPNTRRNPVFMANTCKCPNETYKCVRTGDSVSMSAYIYHCRQNTTADDIEATDYIS